LKFISISGENKKGRALRMQGGLYAWIEPNTLVHEVIQKGYIERNFTA